MAYQEGIVIKPRNIKLPYMHITTTLLKDCTVEVILWNMYVYCGVSTVFFDLALPVEF